uniref:F-box associated beta-propeller type 3 domain-containing protein n=1 Tax=Solanum tuberosum TaxID=4113 RepID=M1DF07_SOLTU
MKFTEPLNNVLDSSDFRVVGSIHGLVNLATTCSHKLNCIWNPSLDEYMLLPTHNVNYEKTKSYVNIRMGFVYNQTSKSYKVIRILRYLNSMRVRVTITEVYSVESESRKDEEISVRT